MPQSKSTSIHPILNNSGFTLLEIIAVMVIMSILAVVAVPKYFDLQAQAKIRAMETAMAEAVGRVNGYFAQQVLAGIDPATIVYDDANLGTDLGDFTLATVDGGASATPVDCSGQTTAVTGCIQLTVSANTGTAVADADDVARVIPRPGGI